MNALTAVTVLVVLASAVSAGNSLPFQEPEKTVSIIGPHPLRVDSLRELWNRTPAVVFATAIRTLPPQAEDDRVVTRIQILEVGEVLKDSTGTIQQGTQIRVRLYGGTVSTGKREVITAFDIEPLRPGEKALLFLAPLPDGRSFQIPYGRIGSYKLSDDLSTAWISPAARHLGEFSGRGEIPKSELIRILASFKAAQ
jgi:hypothetical protein